MRSLAVILLLTPPAVAETVVASRTLRAHTVISAQDVMLIPESIPGTTGDPSRVIGQELRVTQYAGRPLRLADLGPPAVVDRNQLIRMAYHLGPLTIAAEGRALARGGAGEVIRAMNLGSKITVSGRIGPDGTLHVGRQE